MRLRFLLGTSFVLLLSGCSNPSPRPREISAEEAERIAIAYMGQRSTDHWKATGVSRHQAGDREWWRVDVVSDAKIIVSDSNENLVDVDLHTGKVSDAPGQLKM